jgi:hypothetical protein
MMRTIAAALRALVVVALMLASSEAADPSPTAGLWNFDDDMIGAAPAGFTVFRGGRAGRWVVRAASDAPSGGKVLAQKDDDHADGPPPIALADAPVLRDLRVSVRCKPFAGHVQQVCGVVLRADEGDDYYLARADVLDGSVRLYAVKDGRRTRLGSWRGAVPAGVWHTLRVDARADHLEVYWNGTEVIDSESETFKDPGKVGVWTESDGVAEFDDLSVVPLP